MNLENTEIQKLAITIEEFITEKTCDALSTLLNEPVQHKLSMQENTNKSKKKISSNIGIWTNKFECWIPPSIKLYFSSINYPYLTAKIFISSFE